MINSYSSNVIQVKKPYSQIKIIRRKQSRNDRNNSSKINANKLKNKFKFIKSDVSENKSNNLLKSISVNKQIPQHKNQIKYPSTDYDYHFSYNCTPNIKENSDNIILINENQTNKEKSSNQKQTTNNFANNHLKRKMILSVDLNNAISDNCLLHYRDSNGNNVYEKPHIYNCITTNNDDQNITYENTNNNLLSKMSNGAKSNSVNKNQKKNSLIANKKNQAINKVYINSLKNNNLYLNNLNGKTIYNIHNKKHKSLFPNNNNINKKNQKYINTYVNYKCPYKLYTDNSSINLTSSCCSFKVDQNNVNNNNDISKCPNLKKSCHFLRNCTNFNSTTVNYKTNKNHNSSQININDYKVTKKIMSFDNEMKLSLKENKSNSKDKKYQIVRNMFEKTIKFLENTVFKGNNNLICVFLQKILIVYHEIINAFNEENRKLKQMDSKLNEKFEKTQKENVDYIKKLKEKQKEIDSLKKKINNLLSNEKINKENYNLNKIDIRKILNLEKNENVYNSNDKNKIYNDDQYKKVFNLNRKNLDDLDSLYFFDKIIIEKHNTPPSRRIPKLLLKNLKEHK